MTENDKQLQDRWNPDGKGAARATDFLEDIGYKLRDDRQWTMPDPLHVPTEDELSAVRFMAQEWSYGGIINEAAGVAFGRGHAG